MRPRNSTGRLSVVSMRITARSPVTLTEERLIVRLARLSHVTVPRPAVTRFAGGATLPQPLEFPQPELLLLEPLPQPELFVLLLVPHPSFAFDVPLLWPSPRPRFPGRPERSLEILEDPAISQLSRM